MIAHLQTHAEVLTEHVGNKALSDGGEHDLSHNQIHARDMAWLEECDAVVAEVTTPSLGVGYELGIAEKLGKPVLCLFDAGNRNYRLSAMLSGNPRVTVARYQTLDEAEAAMDLFVQQNK
jgi:nucleoside 2-deoxyribosyltransferase